MAKFKLTASIFEAEHSTVMGGTVDAFPIYGASSQKFVGLNYETDGKMSFKFAGGVSADIWVADIAECTLGDDTYVRDTDYFTNQELYVIVADYVKTLSV